MIFFTILLTAEANKRLFEPGCICFAAFHDF